MNTFYKLFINLLITSMVLLPFSSQAGMIGTEQSASASQDAANRDKVNTFLSRADVVAKYESMGLGSKISQDRVNAMTQDEVNLVAGKIDSLPAGGYISEAGAIIIGVFLLLIVWVISRDGK
jgi:hypothetical protein